MGTVVVVVAVVAAGDCCAPGRLAAWPPGRLAAAAAAAASAASFRGALQGSSRHLSPARLSPPHSLAAAALLRTDQMILPARSVTVQSSDAAEG